MFYLKRERHLTKAQAEAGKSAYEYAVGARIEDGDCVVDRWVSQAEAIASKATYSEAEALMLAECIGCQVALFAAVAPVVEVAAAEDEETARRRRVAKHLPREERIARGFASAEEIAAAEVDERRDRIRDEVEADEKRDAERVERAKKAGAAREAAAAKRAERKAEREAQVITAEDVGAVPAEHR